MDPRKLTKKNINKKSKETTYASTQEASFHSYEQSNGSLLIHEENYDIFSDESSNTEIRDKDIPLEKRNLINDASYFKQLSLSFYGNPAPSQQKTVTQEDYRLNYKTEVSRMDNRSLSPTSNKDYFQAWKKSPVITSENEHLQKTFNNFFKFIKTNNFNSTNHTNRPLQSRGKESDKHVLRDNKTNLNVSRGTTRDINAYKIGPNKLNSSLTRIATIGMYPPLTSVMTGAGGLGVIGTASPKNSSQIHKENTNSIKKVLRPSFKKVTSSKPKLISSKNYLSTEPSANDLKTISSSNLIPNKLKMYAQDNLTSFNLKSFMENNTKFQSNIHRSQDKLLSIRPSVINKSNQKVVVPKRTVVAVPSKLVMKNGYFS